MPGVDQMQGYNMRYGPSPIMELPLAVNPTGSARSEPLLRTHFRSGRFVSQALLFVFCVLCSFVSSETHNLQRFFRHILYTNGGHCARRSLQRPWKLGLRIFAWSKPRMFCKESLGKIKFRAFPKRVGPRILSLESVDYFGTSELYWVVAKNKNLNKQNCDGRVL